MPRRPWTDGPRSAIARYAYGFSDDKQAAVRELIGILAILAIVALGTCVHRWYF